MDGFPQLPPEIDEAIDEALTRGATILTGNQRAARTLHHHFDLRNRALGLTHWASPPILAWDAWTANLWHQLLLDGHATRLLLNRAQEHTLWRVIIAADPEAIGLRTADALAELAADAYTRLCAYRGEPRLRTAGVSEDTRAFQRWATAFERRCRTANYLPQAQLLATLTAAAPHLTLNPNGYLLIGFDTLNPAQQHLLDTLHIPFSLSSFAEGGGPAFPATLITAPDAPTELHTAARWLRSHLEHHPTARIALIAPDIENNRPQIDRALRQTLAPELNDITGTGTLPFEFSLGVPLAHTPLVATALTVLAWTTAALPIDRIGTLLLSPHFAGAREATAAPEQTARAQFDAHKLRRLRTLRPELTLDAFTRLAESSPRLALLLAALKAMRRAVTSEALATTETRPAADWADAIRTVLEASGWATARTDDSIEFQTRRKWESLLDELATLDFEGTRANFPDTLATLTRLARQTLFAPESRNAPVQVMSPLEAAGSTFDALWFLRAGDLTWPQPPSSSPLLAFHLQRELHMPGANPTEDAAHARRITERLITSAPLVFASYAQHDAQGTQRPSPTLHGLTQSQHTVILREAEDLLFPPPKKSVILSEVEGPAFSSPLNQIPGAPHPSACLPSATREDLLLPLHLPLLLPVLPNPPQKSVILSEQREPKDLHFFLPPEPPFTPIPLETLDDSTTLPSPPDTVLSGGSTLLKLQAACGFRAFAEQRLFATSLDNPETGMDARERGTAVHVALQHFWNEVRDQATLKSLTTEARHEALDRAIEHALSKTEAIAATDWDAAYLDVQRQRLRDLLDPWLLSELDRRVPFTVIQQEDDLDAHIGPLHLKLRIDRIDRTEHGDVILDYKTGAANPSAWLTDRPDEPQLPLYAILSADPEHLAGVAYAQVRPGKDRSLSGYQTQDGILLKSVKLKTPTLTAQLEDWHRILTQLAEDFYAGDLRVRPKQYPTTCEYCAQRILCRLDITTLEDPNSDEDQEADNG